MKIWSKCSSELVKYKKAQNIQHSSFKDIKLRARSLMDQRNRQFPLNMFYNHILVKAQSEAFKTYLCKMSCVYLL